ncbi:hypothetical protein E2562_024240, partial [Oryza meyeriana var. granulata]
REKLGKPPRVRRERRRLPQHRQLLDPSQLNPGTAGQSRNRPRFWSTERRRDVVAVPASSDDPSLNHLAASIALIPGDSGPDQSNRNAEYQEINAVFFPSGQAAAAADSPSLTTPLSCRLCRCRLVPEAVVAAPASPSPMRPLGEVPSIS